MNHIKIPLWVAVLINVNIVIGSAFFLGASKIAIASGLLAPLSWIICGLMLLPLVIVLAKLSAHYPAAGGIYVYSEKQLGSLWGFISGWGYFIGTAALNAVLLIAFTQGLQTIPAVQKFLSHIGLTGNLFDIFIIALFTLFNLFNIEFLERMQIMFTILKGLPFLLVLGALPFLFDATNITSGQLHWSGLITKLPLVLFAYIGIEACCAIADKIENGHKNAGRVIFCSFALIVLIYTILQAALFCIHGSSTIDPFFSLLPMLTGNQTIITWGNGALSLAMLSSFLGGFYGMFYFNNWNLYAIGKDNSIVFSSQLIRLNKNQAPWICVLVQSLLITLFVLFTKHSDYLITMGDLGTVIAYILSALSFIKLYPGPTGYLALLSCGVLLYICSSSLLNAGIYHAFPFILMLIVGIIGHLGNRKTKPL